MSSRINRGVVAGALVVVAALGGAASEQASDAGARFEALITKYVDVRRAATGDLSAQAALMRAERWKALRHEIAAIDPKGLSPEQQIDHTLMLGQIDGDVHEIEVVRQWARNAEQYLQFGALASTMEQPGTPEEKGKRVVERLRRSIATMEEGKRNLENPPRMFTEGGLYQAAEWRKYLDTDVRPFAEQAGAARGDVLAAVGEAEKALDGYTAFLKDDLLPRSKGSVGIGAQAYNYILQRRWYMTDNAEQILAKGRKAFADTEALAQQVATRIAPGKSWIDVYESLKNDHPPADRIKEAYQQQMDAAQAFLKAHDIVTLPPGERVITVDTPPAMRRSSPFGTFSSVSPFDTNLEGRLVLTPIEDHLTPEQRKERLRSHHTAWIPVIAVHEAYPGHHVQAIKARENPRVLRKITRESIFSEGWGLYTEEFMFEQGFLKGDDVRLTQLRNRLWRAARVIIDVGIHTGTMTVDEGVQFLVDKVRFERYAAELEVGMYVRRPTMVLGYLIGMLEIQDMRAEWEKKYGKPAKPKAFVDRLLHIGALPPSLVRRELMTMAPAKGE